MIDEIIKNLLEDENIKKGTYEFIDNTDFTYADIHILIEQLQQYKQQIDKLKHKIQLLQMDGEIEIKDLQTLLQILKERNVR